MSLKVAFRADASLEIGTGHVMRCLTLADALRQQGATCRFLCSPLEGNLIDAIRQRGYAVDMLALPQNGHVSEADSDLPAHHVWLGKSWQLDAQQVTEVLKEQKQDWLVVDHYALDARWEMATASVRERLLVIDDLADRQHVCDGLLDQNLGSVPRAYEDKVPASCQLFVGPQFALLRPEFAACRSASLARRASGTLRSILVTMGGVDKDNATVQVLEALKAARGMPDSLQIDVVMGQHAPWLQEVRAAAAATPWKTAVHVNTPRMADLMVKSDLAIGAAGSTSWERCVLGLPTVMVVLAANQHKAAKSLEQVGAVVSVELGENFVQAVKDRVERLAVDQELLRAMSTKAAQVTSGKGIEILATWMRGQYE